MKAHVLNASGEIVNTILVDSLNFMPNLIDANVGGSIGDRYVNGVIIPQVVSIPVPEQVLMKQARLALFKAGKLDLIQPAIDNLDEPTKTEAQIQWDFSTTVERNNSFCLLIGQLIGLNDDEMNDLFRLAITL